MDELPPLSIDFSFTQAPVRGVATALDPISGKHHPINPQKPQPKVGDTVHVQLAQPSNPWSKLPAIARRLGVQPSTGPGIRVVEEGTGASFDLMDVISAFLDRLDAAST